MLASYAVIARRAAVYAAIAAVILVVICAALVGIKGLYGALAGVGIVTVFFGISIVVVGRAAKISPQAMMGAALGTFLVKIIALALVVKSMDGMTVLSTRACGFTAIGCILAWSAAQVVAAMQTKTLYVEPGRK
jgi:ATP synthase protein I